MNSSRAAALKECLYCENDFIPKRSDAKFCSSKCRHDAGNLKKRKERDDREVIVGETHRVLWKNRDILLNHLGETVSWDTLKAKGFNFKIHTEIRNIDKASHYGYYDIWLFSSKKNHFKIYKNE